MLRKSLSFVLFGPIWWILIMLFFVLSGAQQYLSNPEYQSEKFLHVFTAIEPLPRMVTNASFIWIGMFIVGFFPAAVFTYLNKLLSGNWIKKGLIYGIIHWALITPWFEFYLPYNVMNEPLDLVLLESFLWLLVALGLGIIISFIVNYRSTKDIKKFKKPLNYH